MFELDKNNSVANHFLVELRDKQVQKDSLRFRRNLERLGEILAYEVSKILDYSPANVNTVLGDKQTMLLDKQPVLMTILRAGIPFFNGFLNIFDKANSGFVGAYRIENDHKNVNVASDYLASGDLTNKELIIVDPMLATGKSLVSTVNHLLKNGTPKRIHIVAAIAAPEGINYIQHNLDVKYAIWVGSIDDRLDENAYIIPGLGDAGDLCFGQKL
ncbi:MAG: uracil phosphoribosyltransferase [Cyclobacteriaceae bacterium]|nr:uracil phosphoribosyltransferase [Cyclobacteriaceae bacterium]